MEEHEIILRHFGTPVAISMEDGQTLHLPRFNIDEFSRVIDISVKTQTGKITESESSSLMLKLFLGLVQRRFQKEIDSGKMSLEACEVFTMDNVDSLFEQLDEFMPKVNNTRISQKAEEIMKQRNESGKPDTKPN